jgi:hypothetical protein
MSAAPTSHAAGDTRPYRDLGYVGWSDPYAALEDPAGAAARAAVVAETRRWDAVQAPLGRTRAAWRRLFESYYAAAFPDTRRYAEEHFEWAGAAIAVQHMPGHRLRVWFDDVAVHEGLTAFGTSATASLYYTIEDVGNGAEYLKLTVYRHGLRRRAEALWSHAPVGPQAAFSEDGHTLYLLDIENRLRSSGVLAAEAASGAHMRTVYENKDPRFMVELHAPRGQSRVFVKIANALSQRIGEITSAGPVWYTPALREDANGAGTTLLPICADLYGTNEALVHGRHRTPLPAGESLVDACIVATAPLRLWVTTVRDAVTRGYLYDAAEREFRPLTVLDTAGRPCNIVLHSHGLGCTLQQPNQADRVYDMDTRTHMPHRLFKKPEPLTLSVFSHGYAGAHRVPFTYVAHVRRPKGLIVEGYGAYGISANRGYPVHWLPWLARGYALAVACPRGGRENGDAWYDGARTALRKHHTFEDVAAVISTVQTRFGHAPRETLMYGRSAGGWLAAAIALHWPSQVGAVLAEVPYLDVLRTTTNPALPLTQLEYDEFGHPAARPADYVALKRWSPVDSVPSRAPHGAPAILIKTAVNDVQVLPYEALKWAARLRDAGWRRVYVAIDGDGGHFAAQDDLAMQHAADAAYLDSVLRPRHRRHTQRRPAATCRHASRGTRRRRSSS